MISAAELKHRLGLIIAQEEAADVDWNMVSRLCSALARDIGEDGPQPVDDYLTTSERRRCDAVFAHAQRSDLISYLRGQ